jgi:hypothetical protein
VVGLEANEEKTECMLLYRHQKAGQTPDTKVTNRPFKNVAQFRYLERTVANQTLSQEEIKRRMNSSNACYYLVQSLISSRLLLKNVKIRIYKTILFAVSHACETWCLTLGKEHRLRVFENRMPRRILGSKRMK